jgi:hypothetical protein
MKLQNKTKNQYVLFFMVAGVMSLASCTTTTTKIVNKTKEEGLSQQTSQSFKVPMFWKKELVNKT